MSTDKARELADKLHDYAHSYFIDTPDEEQEEKQIDSMVPLIERHTAAAVAEETEIKCMQLAACMTATLQNTENTVKDRIGPDSPYWCLAYSDVCRAIDREMELRAERDALKGELAEWRECAGKLAGVGNAVRDELKRVSKGEPETWGFVAMFMDIVATVEKPALAAYAALVKEDAP